MPTIVSHAVAALALANFIPRTFRSAKFWLLVATCSIVPDFDVIAFPLGIPYSHLLGHRGLLHSILFAIIWGPIVSEIFYRDEKFLSKSWIILTAFFSVATLSHGLLDALTNGGLGVAFFAPFDNARYFFPSTPIQVSPLSFSRVFEQGVSLFTSEILWIWLPSLILISLSRLMRVDSAKESS